MKFILKRYLLTVVSIFITAQIIPAFSLNNGWYGLFYGSFILSIFFYIIAPILNLIMLPINLITLNLSSWIVQIIIFYLWTIVVAQMKITPWQFSGLHIGPIILSSVNLIKWQVIIILAIIFIILNKLLNWIFR